MAKRCRQCGVDVGGGFMKPYKEGVITYRMYLIKYTFCGKECCKKHAESILNALDEKEDPSVLERDRLRFERQREREKQRGKN